MALAVQNDMDVQQMDVKTAYLNGDIDEEIYMSIPDMYEETLVDIISDKKTEEEVKSAAEEALKELKKGKKCCRFNKSLYGLKQSGRQWYKKLDNTLQKLGMTPLHAEPCLYYKGKGEDLLLLTIYVDDIILASKSSTAMTELKVLLKREFIMKDIGGLSSCLGIEFTHRRSEGKITISQSKYVSDLLERFGMGNSKPVSTPVEYNMKLRKPGIPSKKVMSDYPYQSLIGSLMYLSVASRPDITFAVNYLSQFNTNYSEEHWLAAKRVLRYLRGTTHVVLEYTKNGGRLEGFVDADWGSCPDDRRSYTGYVFTMAGGAVSWEAKKQQTVALSSTEAEYMAMAQAAKEAIHLKSFLNEIGICEVKEPVILNNDNQGAQKLARNPIYHARSKHIDLRHHFIREAINNGHVQLKYLKTKDMTADALTKGLLKLKHQKFMKNMGLISTD